MRPVSLLPTSHARGATRTHYHWPGRVSVTYALGLVSVGFGLLLLPVSYFSVVSLMLWSLVAHLIGHVGWINGTGASLPMAAGYLSLGVVLGLVSWFLIRPLLSSLHKSDLDLALMPHAEPRLYSFIEQICTAIGAKTPRCIQVNMDVNASVRFAPGIRNFWGGQLELVLGLPLVRGLDLGQFAGVLAHELGHFQQGSAMRLVHGMRTLIHWFQRASTQEGDWEKFLEKKSHRIDPLVFLPGWSAKICSISVRAIFKLHAQVGQIISCILLRQMEYKADWAAVRMVGGETFSSMVLEAKVIESAWTLANRSLGMALREGRLADDLPALVAAHTRVFIPEVRRKMERSLMQEKAVWFDTHPSLSKRVQRARQHTLRGMFHAVGQAHSLFSDFSLLSKQASEIFYRQDLGQDFNPARMISTSDLVTGQSEIQVGEAALTGYFLGYLTNLRPFWLVTGALQGLPSGNALRIKLNQARETIEKSAGTARSLYHAFSVADAKELDAIQALSLLRANFWIEPEDFQLPKGGIHEAEILAREAEAEQKEISAQLTEFETAMHIRMVSALGLLSDPEVGAHLKDAFASSREVSRLLPSLEAMGKIQRELESLRRNVHAMGILLENLTDNETTGELQKQLSVHTLAIHRNLDGIKVGLGETEYPFGLHSGGLGLAGYAICSLPSEEDYAGYHLAAEEVLGRCYAFYFRIMGRLALAAGRVEGVLGLGPIQVGGFD